VALFNDMKAPVPRCPGTVPRTHGSLTLTCAAAGAANSASNKPNNEIFDDMT
jgi:hypothetical protein